MKSIANWFRLRIGYARLAWHGLPRIQGAAVPNECIPYYEPGQRITGHCEAAVTGKRLVDISDPQQAGGPGSSPALSTTTTGGNIVVSLATAGALTIGAASHDAAIAAKVAIIGPGSVVPITALGAITAGQEVEVATGGKVAPQDTGRAVGRAYGSAADGADCPVHIYSGASGAAF